MRLRDKERLLKLAATLKTIPNKLFDLDHIVEVDIHVSDFEDGWDFDYDAYDAAKANALKEMAKFEPNCGAVACAVGWCPYVFPRSFKWEHSIVTLKDGTDEYSNFQAVEKFFGINTKQCEYLFMPQSYHKSKRGPKSVAARIESFVERDGKLSQKFLDTHTFILGEV